jgi:hypothetical protein
VPYRRVRIINGDRRSTWNGSLVCLSTGIAIEGHHRLPPRNAEGVAIMTMAIANHELAKEHFLGIFPSPEEMAEEARRQAAEPTPCLAQGKGLDVGKSCVSEVGHKGRHRFRFILPPTEGVN